jgi:hypothetical protein
MCLIALFDEAFVALSSLRPSEFETPDSASDVTEVTKIGKPLISLCLPPLLAYSCQ